MSKKTDIKTCRFMLCNHPNKEIDITKDEYVVKGSMYYHKDCYSNKQKGEWKDEKTKADLQLIKNLWSEHISRTVVYSQLMRCLNELIARDIDSGYLVFVMQYVIEHKLNLRYPMGFKYYVDKQEIQDAYNKKVKQPNKVNMNSFSVNSDNDDSPKFSINQKPTGFNRILGGK